MVEQPVAILDVSLDDDNKPAAPEHEVKVPSTKDLKSRLAQLVKTETPQPKDASTLSASATSSSLSDPRTMPPPPPVPKPSADKPMTAAPLKPAHAAPVDKPVPRPAPAVVSAALADKPRPISLVRPASATIVPAAAPAPAVDKPRGPMQLQDVFKEAAPAKAPPPPPVPATRPDLSARPLSVNPNPVPLFHAPPSTAASSSPWALSGLAAGGPSRVFGGGKGGNSGAAMAAAAAAAATGSAGRSPASSALPQAQARPATTSPAQRPQTMQYEISDKESSGGSSDDDDDNDDDDDDESKPRKHVPNWAKGNELRDALEKQYVTSKLDPDEIFPEQTSCEPLEEIFKDAALQKLKKNQGFRPRGSSAIWTKDGLSKTEILAYRKAMGLER